MILGITGGIGTGKSSVLKILQEFGIETISADCVARQLSQKGSKAYNQIVELFGVSILKDGEIDRSALGKIVFNDEIARKKLESILHPGIISIIQEKIDSFRENNPYNKIYAVEVPLLYESGMQNIFDKILVVSAELDKQLSRLKRTGLSEKDAIARISTQMPLEEKCILADFVVENNSSLIVLKEKVEEIKNKLADDQ